MSEDLKFPVPEDFKKSAHITDEIYKDLYNESQRDNVGFWKRQGKRIDWIKPYSKIKNVIWSKKKVDINWFYDGSLNVSANCIDRHLKTRGNQTAIIWEGDDPKESKKITYKELYEHVCKSQTKSR